ncbi:hypothetical protein FAZ19_01510 [Sphingobacterium alkalisoli]|uniref:Uncharacterized protein n=1 Tax=Sphingobacterium alkalisoli TaxID=1874115 RepID=A0A4U0H7Z3_9SPHI|nr:hypothetical protein [Sphingobacterium alkalisoli]TJY67967.1 hypothetical protein FAZ19_01510 [Sphingobacterium alkalisoli]GGH10033.1 hypothetical protein GCM10011418_08270 [Sphingobacterium alkalisoli]
MENQVTESKSLNVKSVILLIGVLFGALISFAANETFLSIIGGAVVGLVIAILFNSYILPQKPHDR